MVRKKNKNINKEIDKKKINKLNFIIFLISIISIILSFYIYLYIIPVCIICIIICLLFRNASKLYYLYTILFIICIIISIVMYIFFKPKPFNDLVGTWNCSYYDESNISISIVIDKDKKFIWSKYSDKKNNYIKGTYTLNKLDKKDKIDSVKYYKFIINSNEYINNGIKQDKEYKKTYELAINNSEEKAIFISYDNTMLKCSKINRENPVIE